MYDSDITAWTIHPWFSDMEPPSGGRDSVYASPMHAAGCVYSKYPTQTALLCLDTRSVGFSVVPLPPGVLHTTRYAVGETKDAECCLVSFVPDPPAVQIMKVWLRREPCWEMQRKVRLGIERALPRPVFQVRAVAAGVVLVCLEKECAAGTAPAVAAASTDHVAFCIDSFQVQARFKSGESVMHPYQAPWPSVLSGTK